MQAPMPPSFITLDYSLHHHLYPQNQQEEKEHHHHLMKFRVGETYGELSNEMVDYIPHKQQPPPQQILLPCLYATTSSFDKLRVADVMQFADFGPKLALNQGKACEEPGIVDPGYLLKFPVSNDKMEDQNLIVTNPESGGEARNDRHERFDNVVSADQEDQGTMREDDEARVSEDNNPVQLRFLGHEELLEKNSMVQESKNKRKRSRTVKTSEEVESQRMTHIAVERNRRKQMNEHLRVLRSLMPGSYVQRVDQASIIGGAIEFVRELEQLIQCLESQKRRRLLGEALAAQQQPLEPPPFFPSLPLPNDQMKLVELETGLREETAESKTCLADVEVKLLGFDAVIKILSRRRPGQLIKTIAALEDLQLIILHTNITTIEQTVLYSFNVKVVSDSRFTAEDIASSIQQIFSFIHANTST